MRTILLLLLTASLSVAQRPASPTGRQVLQDFRSDRTFADVKIPAKTQRNVLTKVFRKYLSDGRKCNQNFDAGGESDHLAAARKAGQFAPTISDVATGSFTAAGQPQTLYVISVNECNASHADNYGTKRVAIFSGQQLVADLDVDFKNSIVRKTDLDFNGINELLMTSGDMAQGTLIEMAALLSFQDGRLRVVHDFGTVVEDSCASGFPGSAAKASVLYFSNATLGSMPTLAMDNYTSNCTARKRWRFLSSGKMPE